MARVITIAQQKGGCGKTMLAANLAACWAASHRVALLDGDPQRSLTRWHAIRTARAAAPAAITFREVAGWRLGTELDRLRAAHDYVLIDSPPQIDTDAKLAIRRAVLVLIPVQPSPPDLWAAHATIALAGAEGRPVAIVLNRAPATSRLRTTVLRDIAASGTHRLEAGLGNRAAFANAFAEGLAVTEAAGRSVAAGELRALAAEIEVRLA